MSNHLSLAHKTESLSHVTVLWDIFLFAPGVFLQPFFSLCSVGNHNPQAPVTSGFRPDWPVRSTGGRCQGISLCVGCRRGLSSSSEAPLWLQLLLGSSSFQVAQCPGSSNTPSSLYPSRLGGQHLPAIAHPSLTVFSFVSQLCKNNL